MLTVVLPPNVVTPGISVAALLLPSSRAEHIADMVCGGVLHSKVYWKSNMQGKKAQSMQDTSDAPARRPV